MKLKDLNVEVIKTIMSTQRMVLTPKGFVVSIIQEIGAKDYLVQVCRHNLKIDESVDAFATKVVIPDDIDFKHIIFTFRNASENIVDNLLQMFEEVEWHEPRNRTGSE